MHDGECVSKVTFLFSFFKVNHIHLTAHCQEFKWELYMCLWFMHEYLDICTHTQTGCQVSFLCDFLLALCPVALRQDISLSGSTCLNSIPQCYLQGGTHSHAQVFTLSWEFKLKSSHLCSIFS